VIFRRIAAPDAQFFGSQSIQGVLKNSQEVSGAQGYEPNELPDCSTPRFHHNNLVVERSIR
jgi:hypothetical protein